MSGNEPNTTKRKQNFVLKGKIKTKGLPFSFFMGIAPAVDWIGILGLTPAAMILQREKARR